MPATTAFSSQLSELRITIGATPTTINQIRGISGPSFGNWDIREITSLSSPDSYKEWLPIMKDPGNVVFQLIYKPDDDAHEYLRAKNAAAVASLETFSEVLTNATGSPSIDFVGYVTKFEIKLNHGEECIADVEVKPTGAVTFTP